MPEGYTLLQLRDRVRRILMDDNKEFITDPEVNDLLNDALLDIAFRTRSYRKEVPGTTSGNTLALPSDFLAAISLRLGTDDDVEFVEDQMWWDQSDTSADLEHSIARVFGSNIEIYPTPTTGTAYKLRYAAKPATLSADGNQPDVPHQLQLKAVHKAKAECLLKLGKADSADRYMALYEAGLPARPMNDRYMPGPLNFVLEPGPFDDSDARHI